MENLKYEAIDIFSGCGGASCGLTQAGFKIKSAIGNAVPIDLVKACGAVFKDAISALRSKRNREKEINFYSERDLPEQKYVG